MMNIIVKPLISEKMTRLTEAAAAPVQTRIQRKKGIAAAPARNRYGFVVDKRANKIEIKKAVEEIFGVTVIKVTTENVRGKAKRTGSYPMGKTASWKKAVVKLSADS